MTVASQDPINSFVITSTGQTSGVWSWQLNAEADLTVFKQLVSTGVVVPLTLDTDYSVVAAGLGNKTGGTITFLAPQLPTVVGDIWTLQRDTVLSRKKDFAVAGDFQAVTVNPQFDDPILMSQDIKRDVDQALRKDPGIGSVLNPLIPQPVNRRTIIFESDGEDPAGYDIVMSDNDPDGEADAAAASAAEAAASAVESAASAVESAGSADDSADSATTSKDAAANSLESADDAELSAEQAAASAAGVEGWITKIIEVRGATSYSGNFFTVTEQETVPTAIVWNDKGTKFFIVGTATDTVYEYRVSRAYELSSTITYTGNSYHVVADGSPEGLAWNNDGSKLFVLGGVNNTLFEYDVSVAYTLGVSGANVSVSGNSAALTEDSSSMSATFNADGTKLFILGTVNDTLFEYDVSVAFDLGVAGANVSYSGNSFDFGDQEAQPTSAAFSNDGDKLFVVGTAQNTVFEYEVSEPFNLGVAGANVSVTGESFSIKAQDGIVESLVFSGDGTKFYALKVEISTGVADNLYEYDLIGEFSLGVASLFSGDAYNTDSEENAPKGIAWNNDGTKFFVVGTEDTSILEYTVSLPFDLDSTITYSEKSFGLNAHAALPVSVSFNTDGTKFFILDDDTDTIYEYDLSVAFDLGVSGANVSYSGNFLEVGDQEANPQGMAWNNDGTKVFIVGTAADTVFEYTVATGFDLGSSTAYSTDSFLVRPQENAPQGIVWNANGTKFFIVGLTHDTVFEYNVGTPFTLDSVITYSGESISVHAQTKSPRNIVFSADGTQYFIVGGGTFNIYAYDAPLPFDLNAAVIQVESSDNGFLFRADTTAQGVDIRLPDSTDLGLDFRIAVVKKIGAGELRIDVRGEDTVNGLTDPIIQTAFNKITTYALDQSRGEWTASQEIDIEEEVETLPLFLNKVTEVRATTDYSENFTDISEDTTLEDLTWNNDGSKFYIVGGDNNTIYEYSVTINFNLASTINYTGNSMEILASEEATIKAMAWNNDGSKFFITGTTDKSVHEYRVSVPYTLGIDGANVIYTDNFFSVGDIEDTPSGMDFSTDGARFFIVGPDTATVFEFSMNHPFDLSGGVGYSGESFDVSNEDSAPEGLVFSPDGSKFFIVGTGSDTVYEYTLSAPFSLAAKGVVYSGEFHSVETEESAVLGMAWNNDGNKFFIVGGDGEAVFEYDALGEFELGDASHYTGISKSPTTPVGIFGLTFDSTGKQIYVVDPDNDRAYGYPLTVAYDLSTFVDTPSSSFFNGQTVLGSGIVWNNDGTKFWVTDSDSTSSTIFEYGASKPFSLHLPDYTGLLVDVSSEDEQPTDMAWSPDGLKFIMLGAENRAIYEYDVSPAFSLGINGANVTYTTESFSVATQASSPQGIAFKPDGTRFIITDAASKAVYEYTVETGFDLSSAVAYSGEQMHIGQDSQPRGIAWNNDGTKFYIAGSHNKAIYEYAPPAPYELENATIALSAGNNGSLIRCDTSSGEIDIRLPNSKTLTGDWRVGIVMVNSTDNVVVSVVGEDKVNGATDAIVQTTPYKIFTYVLDQSEGAYTVSAESTVATEDIDDLAVTTAKIADLAVTTAKLGALAVTTAKIDALAVTTAKIAAANVTLAKMASNSVDTSQLVADSVTTAKIDAGAVDTTELAALSVTTAKIAGLAVTPVKLSNDANSGLAKAWLRYNQAGPTINASFNIGSVTDVSAGQFTVNFTTNFSSANYAFAGMTTDVINTNLGAICQNIGNPPTAGSCRFKTFQAGTANLNDGVSWTVFFGNQ